MTRNASRFTERLLFCVGLAAAVLAVALLAPRLIAKQRTPRPAADTTESTAAERPATEGSVVGELEMPAVHLKSAVLEGCTPQTMRAASCRMASTARIGGLGTVAIAGHRDASFAALRNVKQNDNIAVRTAAGVYRYRVDDTIIVSPDEVDVLRAGERPGMVLITCYPFHYVGPAPKRFIVRAHLLSVLPSPPESSREDDTGVATP